MEDQIIEWLLEGDPAVKWQVQRDILDLNHSEYNKTRESMRDVGWAKQLIDHQNNEKTWNGLYNPKYTSPFYVLLLLKRLGYPRVSPELESALKSIIPKSKFKDGGISYGWSHSEACVTGMFLSITSYFCFENKFHDEILNYADSMQFKDGGWNCRYPRIEATHSSFNTTYSMIEGLLEYSKWKNTDVSDLTYPAHEFFLEHKLYKSHKTGKPAHRDFSLTTFPQRWKYNFLGGLDYFRKIEYDYDDRFKDAISLLIKRRKNGKWDKGTPLKGKEYFKLETERGVSRYNTMRALKVLKWYNKIVSSR